MNNKNLISDCPGGGGVHGNPIWPMDYVSSAMTVSLTVFDRDLRNISRNTF